MSADLDASSDPTPPSDLTGHQTTTRRNMTMSTTETLTRLQQILGEQRQIGRASCRERVF